LAVIEESLLTILDNLPRAIEEECPEDAVFLPELDANERHRRKNLLRIRKQLKQQSAYLESLDRTFSSTSSTSSESASAVTTIAQQAFSWPESFSLSRPNRDTRAKVAELLENFVGQKKMATEEVYRFEHLLALERSVSKL
jgi:hypothetical protein